jgi:phosphoribosylformylglycinamidine (FGAM) synthase PurS component
MKFAVYLNIAYKPGVRDPEGDTIKRELFSRAGLDVDVRAGKCLVLTLEASGEDEAREKAVKLAWDLRLGNPNVHVVEVVRVLLWEPDAELRERGLRG